MLTHDDACLGDVCALATHDSNLGYHLPVGRQPTFSFFCLTPVGHEPRFGHRPDAGTRRVILEFAWHGEVFMP